MNKREIDEILRDGAKKIDITPTMHKEATDHYKAIGSFLDDNNVPVDIKPYGSFMMGTPTRPLIDDKEGYFDIDVAVERSDLQSGGCTPEETRNPIEDKLLSSDRYGNKATVDDSCITVEYVSNGKEGGFRLDLNVCVADPESQEARRCATAPIFADTAIQIARRSDPGWIGSNPKGLSNWFKEINEKFALEGRSLRKSIIAQENRAIYASVEDVPDNMDRSDFQRAVQVAKRSRDVFYKNSSYEKTPGSYILTVLFGLIGKELPANSTVSDILAKFIEEMKNARELSDAGFECILGRRGAWTLQNPVYDENLLDGWTDGFADRFFRWVSHLEKNLQDLCGDDVRRSASSQAIFGKTVGRSIAPVAAVAAPSVITHPQKPWRL